MTRTLRIVTEEPDERTVSRVGTAKTLVVVAAALATGAAILVCLAMVIVGPAARASPRLANSAVLGGVVFLVIVLLFAAVAGVLAARGRTVGAVVVPGCGLLLVGIVVAVGTTLLLISRSG